VVADGGLYHDCSSFVSLVSAVRRRRGWNCLVLGAGSWCVFLFVEIPMYDYNDIRFDSSYRLVNRRIQGSEAFGDVFVGLVVGLFGTGQVYLFFVCSELIIRLALIVNAMGGMG